MEIGKLIATFFVGMFGSFIGAMVGSGGLISIPFLIFIGLPPQIAIATNKFGAVGLKLGVVTKFWKTKHIKWKYFLPFTILSFVAAFVGSNILLSVDKEILKTVVSVILLIILPFIFLKKDIGVSNMDTSSIKKYVGFVLYFASQVYGAFFGGGSASIMFYVLIAFFGLTLIEASATTTLPSLIMNLTTLVIFGMNGILDYKYGIVIFFGMLIGGWLGAHTALKKGNSWVKGLFAIIVVFAALKMLLT